MKKFNVEFTENKKYNPATRSVVVETTSEFAAEQLVHNNFGSFKYDRDLMRHIPSGKISIVKTTEVKEEK